jgi:hypothetical protein
VERQPFIDLLQSGDFAGVRFSYRRFCVDPAGLRCVADMMRCGAISVLPLTASAAHPAAGEGQASYQTSTKLSLPSGFGAAGIGDTALVLHECVHALQDLKRAALTLLEAEFTAYVAQLVYLAQELASLARLRVAVAQRASDNVTYAFYVKTLDVIERHDLVHRYAEIPQADAREPIALLSATPVYGAATESTPFFVNGIKCKHGQPTVTR